MTLVIESALAIGFRTAGGCCSTYSMTSCRSSWSSDYVIGVHIAPRRLFQPSGIDILWNKVPKLIDAFSFTTRKNPLKSKIRATIEQSSSASGPFERDGNSFYHPFEEIKESTSQNIGEARLTTAETSRTIIEVNSKATLMFSGLINDEVQENIFWPDLSYVTDEYGNIYFQVNNDEDILQTLTSENNLVQVIIGLDTVEMLKEMELSESPDIDFGFEEILDEDSDVDDDNDEDSEKDWVSVLEDEEDELDSDDTIGDWAKLETMSSSHPMYFAKKLAKVASDLPVDWIDQPPSGIAIQGFLRPAFVEEHTVIQKSISGHDQSSNDDMNQVGKPMENKLEDLGMLNGHENKSASSKDSSVWSEELEKDENQIKGTSFYKLEMTKIQLLSADGHQTIVEVDDFRKAEPDAIAHSAAKIIARLKSGGDKTIQALKSLCWRGKGIQVEEATLIVVDSLGFDLRVCSGTQVQTLRFAFDARATSEYSAERQLNDLLFPRIHHKQQKQLQDPQKNVDIV